MTRDVHLTLCCDATTLCGIEDVEGESLCTFIEKFTNARSVERLAAFVDFKAKACPECLRKGRWLFRSKHGSGTSR